jgi:K+-sensing histidine kinase KdpD
LRNRIAVCLEALKRKLEKTAAVERRDETPGVPECSAQYRASPYAETMIGPAVRFAKAVGADLSFVFAGTRNRAKELEPLARANGAQVLVVEGDAATAIVAAAEARPGSVVALATHARGGLVKLFRGSVADDVVHHTKTPVLIINAEEAVTA